MGKRFLCCWRGPENHNWRRITRILRCLRLVSMAKEQRAFYAALESIIAEIPGTVDEKTVNFWRNEVSAVRRHTISANYTSALLHSEAVLTTICKSHFRRFDTDESGFLEFNEILQLSRELHGSLGMSESEAQDPVHLEELLVESLQKFGGEQRNSLNASEFPEWFSQVLKTGLKETDDKPVLTGANSQFQRFTNTEYASLVFHSPEMLSDLAQNMFKRYDLDGDGVLDLSEAIKLSRELHTSLGLPAETLDEWALLASLNKFGRNGQSNSVGPDEFPGWFAESLQSSLDRMHAEN